MFVTVPRAHFGRTPFLTPLALRGAFEDLEDLWEALAPVPNQKAFEDTMQGVPDSGGKLRRMMPG